MGVVLDAMTSLWTRGRLKVNDAVVGAVADAVEDLKTAGRTVITESWPGTAVDTLPQWHDTLGVAYDPTRAVADQQTTLAAMMTARGGVAILKFQNQIQKEFPLVTVEEIEITARRGLARYGVSRYGVGSGVISNESYRLSGTIPNASSINRLTAIVRRYGPAHMIPTSDLAYETADVVNRRGLGIMGRSFCSGVAATPSIPAFGASPYIAGVAHVGNTLYVYTPEVEGVPTPALTYQWKLDGVDVPGGNSVAFTVTESGSFTVEVTASNSAGSTMEETAALVTPNFPPIINSAAVYASGSSLFLTIVSDGRPDPTFGYQWKFNGGDIIGETGASLNLTGRSPGSYTCEVTATNSEGATSLLSGAYIATAPTLSWSGALTSFSAPLGQKTILSAAYTSGGAPTPTPSFAWYKNSVLLITGNYPSINVPNVPGDQYYTILTLTNPVGSTNQTSSTITL